MARNIRTMSQKFYTCTAYVMLDDGLKTVTFDVTSNSEQSARKAIAAKFDVKPSKVIIDKFETKTRVLRIIDLEGAIAAGFIVEVEQDENEDVSE